MYIYVNVYLSMYLLYIYIYIYISGNQRKFRVERLSSDSLGSFAGNRCTPRGEEGRAGREGANQPRARASEIRAAAQLHSIASVTHRRRGLARSGMDWQATTIAIQEPRTTVLKPLPAARFPGY